MMTNYSTTAFIGAPEMILLLISGFSIILLVIWLTFLIRYLFRKDSGFKTKGLR